MNFKKEYSRYNQFDNYEQQKDEEAILSCLSSSSSFLGERNLLMRNEKELIQYKPLLKARKESLYARTYQNCIPGKENVALPKNTKS